MAAIIGKVTGAKTIMVAILFLSFTTALPARNIQDICNTSVLFSVTALNWSSDPNCLPVYYVNILALFEIYGKHPQDFVKKYMNRIIKPMCTEQP